MSIGVAVDTWIVIVGEKARAETTDEAGVTEFGLLVIALADDGTADGVEEARFLGSGPFVEIAGILLEEHGHYELVDTDAGNEIGITGPIAFGVAFCALSKAFIGVASLIDAGAEGD